MDFLLYGFWADTFYKDTVSWFAVPVLLSLKVSTRDTRLISIVDFH